MSKIKWNLRSRVLLTKWVKFGGKCKLKFIKVSQGHIILSVKLLLFYAKRVYFTCRYVQIQRLEGLTNEAEIAEVSFLIQRFPGRDAVAGKTRKALFLQNGTLTLA